MDELQPRRGRPPKYVESQVEEGPGPRPRTTRKPFGGMQQKLAYPDRPGFHRHWFNDVPGRISRAEEAGYEHVKNDEGKNVSAVVGVAEHGGPLHAYLMEIPEEWWKEDMDATQRTVDEKEAAMKRGQSQTEKSYVPAQGISFKFDK